MDLARLFKAPKSVFAASLVCMLSTACLDMASNYGDVLPPVDDTTNPGGGGTGGGGTGGGGTGGGGGGGTGGGGTGGGGGGTTDPDAGTDPDPGTDPGTSVIAGSAVAAGCVSYKEAAGGMCGGFYCGVTLEDIEAEYKAGGKCQLPLEQVCSGQVSMRTTECTRTVRLANLTANFDTLGPKIIACVREDASIQASDECMQCYADAGICGGKNCTSQCLAGNSAACEKCRMDNGCNQIVPSCGGFPSPF